MNVLVTGGAGFIGSHIVDALVRGGHRVRVLDNFYSGKKSNLSAVKKDIELVTGNCEDQRAARRAVRGVEVVFHEGAVPSVARSVADPMLSHRANGTATLQMLIAGRDAGVRRFIYAGSSSVYGNSKILPKREGMTPAPRSPYAVEKLTGEHFLRVFAELYGMETLTLRYFNVFGPRQDPSSPYSGVISLFTQAILEGRRSVFLRRRACGHRPRNPYSFPFRGGWFQPFFPCRFSTFGDTVATGCYRASGIRGSWRPLLSLA